MGKRKIGETQVLLSGDVGYFESIKLEGILGSLTSFHPTSWVKTTDHNCEYGFWIMESRFEFNTL